MATASVLAAIAGTAAPANAGLRRGARDRLGAFKRMLARAVEHGQPFDAVVDAAFRACLPPLPPARLPVEVLWVAAWPPRGCGGSPLLGAA